MFLDSWLENKVQMVKKVKNENITPNKKKFKQFYLLDDLWIASTDEETNWFIFILLILLSMLSRFSTSRLFSLLIHHFTQ